MPPPEQAGEDGEIRTVVLQRELKMIAQLVARPILRGIDLLDHPPIESILWIPLVVTRDLCQLGMTSSPYR